MNIRGRQRTEAALRAIYENGDPAIRDDAIRFLKIWRSKRRKQVVSVWFLATNQVDNFQRLLWTWYPFFPAEGFAMAVNVIRGKTAPEFMADEFIDSLDTLVGLYGPKDKREEVFSLILEGLEHSCGEVRWTSIFLLAADKDIFYPNFAAIIRSEIARFTEDGTDTRYGKVSEIAKRAIRYLDSLEEELHPGD